MPLPSNVATWREWYRLGIAFLVLTVPFGFAVFAWPALYRPLAAAYHSPISSANTGGAIVLFCIGMAGPVIGLLVERFTAKRVILAGCVADALAFAMLSRADTLPSFYAACVLLGLGAAACSILPASLLLGGAFARHRGLAVGAVNAGVGVGGMIAPRLVTAELAEGGLDAAFLTLAGSMVVPFVLGLVATEERRVVTAAPQRPSPRMGDLLRARLFWMYGLALFCSALGMMGVQQNLISHLTGEHLPSRTAAWILSIAMGSTIIGKLVSGVVADRCSARAATATSVIGVALGIVALLSVGAEPALVTLVAVLFGIGYGGVFNAAPVIIFEHLGTRHVATSFGLFYVFFGLGTSLGGPLAAVLFERTGNWMTAFTADLALVLAGLVFTAVGAGTGRAATPRPTVAP